MKHPNPLMLLRIAQGDAYGLATEYVKFPRDQHVYDAALRFERYQKHPTHSLKPGQYSDDTQMSVAVAEVLLKHPVPLRRLFAQSFFDCFKRDPRDGYSRGFQALLEKHNTLDALLDELKPDSDKNGAAMRSVPIGVFADISHVKYVANQQAKITHDTLGGVYSAIIVALMSHFALHTDEPMSRLPEWLREKMPGGVPRFLERWPGGPVKTPDVGIATARAVMTLVSEEKTLLDIARKTIEWGGDTDSVLAIAWGIASTRMREDLPAFFEGGLEDGTYGRDYLIGLGTRLMNTYSR